MGPPLSSVPMFIETAKDSLTPGRISWLRRPPWSGLAEFTEKLEGVAEAFKVASRSEKAFAGEGS